MSQSPGYSAQQLQAAQARLQTDAAARRGGAGGDAAKMPGQVDPAVQALAEEVARLREELEQAVHTPGGVLSQKMFPAKLTGGSGGWQERFFVSGGWVDMTGGRNDSSGAFPALPLPDVLMIERRDPANGAAYFYVTGGWMIAKVTSNATGGGKFNGKSFTPPTADISATTDLAETDLGTIAGSEDTLILNPPELGAGAGVHRLTATANTSIFSLYAVGPLLRVNAGGVKVMVALQYFAGC